MFEQRDILLIPVPFTDLTSSKARPVLVLSHSEYNRESPDILVAAITSNIVSNSPGLIIYFSDLEQGHLPRQSRIRADKIYTLSQSIVRKRFGRLSSRAFISYLATFDQILGR